MTWAAGAVRSTTGAARWSAPLASADEVRAVREAAGLIDVSTLGKIEIFGPDAGAFLDRIYAGSFSDLRVGTHALWPAAGRNGQRA